MPWMRRSLALLILLLLIAPSHRPVSSQSPPLFLPLQAHTAVVAAAPHALLVAFLPDGLAANDADEAIAIQNVGANPLSLAGWRLSDGEGEVVLPGISLAAGEMVWCARQALAFLAIWGRPPGCEYEFDGDPAVPDARGSAPRLANGGDELQLFSPEGRLVDAVVYADGKDNTPGWQGESVAYYQRNNRFAREGQVFYRLFHPATHLPLADSDSAGDWAQGNEDPARGRRAAYAGWELHAFSQAAIQAWPQPITARLLVAPDNMLAGVAALFNTAQHSIYLETYELDHPDLVAILAARARAGVEVRLLLEGAPSGGLSDQTRWAAQQIVTGGGQVHFMVNDVGDASDRYPFIHAKFALIDGKTLLLSSENFKANSMPVDVADGETWGRRGYALILEDEGDGAVLRRAQAIFTADDDPSHPDIFPWQADHPTYGAPPPGYFPPAFLDQRGYAIRYPAPATINLDQALLFTAPETSLTPGPLLDLLARAGPGDLILVQQLYEHTHWGARESNPLADPNPRLEALIAAARRGASVRLLLDAQFDDPADPASNAVTVDYVNNLAAAQGLDLQARRGNPTGGGIHAKLHLLALGHERWVVLGSLNGGEVSNKLNRELSLAFRSHDGFAYLAGVFWDDWPAE